MRSTNESCEEAAGALVASIAPSGLVRVLRYIRAIKATPRAIPTSCHALSRAGQGLCRCMESAEWSIAAQKACTVALGKLGLVKS